MRTGEVQRVADMVEAAGHSPQEILVAAVELAVREGLVGAEIVALVNELEKRLGIQIHPFRF